jgi:hypothetical protein
MKSLIQAYTRRSWGWTSISGMAACIADGTGRIDLHGTEEKIPEK